MISKTAQIAVLYGPRIDSMQQGVKTPVVSPQLEPGKMTFATVVESRGQNMFMLEAAGLRFEVQSQLPLTKGEQIQVQVMKTSPVLELQKVDSGIPAQVRQSLALAGDIIDVKPLLQSLQKSFFSVPQTPLSTSPASATIATQPAAAALQLSLATAQKMEPGAVEQLVREGNYTVKATVLEHLGENRIVVRIAGESYQLQGHVPAAPGESKQLRLQSLQPVPVFMVVDEKGVVDKTQPLSLTTQTQSLSPLMRALQLPLFTGLDLLPPTQQQLLQNLQSLHPDRLQEPGAGELLKSNLEQLGIRSETLVAQGRGKDSANQLKSVLAEITRMFQGQEEIVATASRLLATLEVNQFAQASLQQDNGLLFPLLYSFLQKGYLMVDQDNEADTGKNSAEDSCSCTLHLSVEGLGDIRVRCVQDKESVRIAFFLDSQEKADFVSTFDAELKEKISSAPLLSLNFATGAGSPGTALLQKIIPDKQPIVNTRA